MFGISSDFWQFASTGLVAIVLATVALRFMPSVLDRLFDSVPGFDRLGKTGAYFVSDSLGIGLLLLFALFALSQLPDDGRLVALVVTVASGAFIFTSEGWAQDALAGVSLQLYPQYKVGEWITVGEERRGRVIRVGLFRTFLSTLELDIVTIRNSKILSEDVINHSGIQLRQLRIIVHTAGYGEYGDDIVAYKADLAQIAQDVQNDVCPDATLEHGYRPEVYFMEFGSSSDHLQINYYGYDRDEDYHRAVDAMHTAIAELMRPRGVVLGQVNANTIDNLGEYFPAVEG